MLLLLRLNHFQASHQSAVQFSDTVFPVHHSIQSRQSNKAILFWFLFHYEQKFFLLSNDSIPTHELHVSHYFHELPVLKLHLSFQAFHAGNVLLFLLPSLLILSDNFLLLYFLKNQYLLQLPEYKIRFPLLKSEFSLLHKFLPLLFWPFSEILPREKNFPVLIRQSDNASLPAFLPV